MVFPFRGNFSQRIRDFKNQDTDPKGFVYSGISHGYVNRLVLMAAQGETQLGMELYVSCTCTYTVVQIKPNS